LEWKKFKKPHELQNALKKTLEEMTELVKANLHPQEYTMDELCGLLETTHEEIVLNSLNQNTAHCKNSNL
jgi:hypothetical protein